MDEPQNDLIEQIISASLAKQSALREKAPAGDGPPDAPAPKETPPDNTGKPPPKPEQSKTEQSKTEQSKTDPPPKAGKVLVGLTAALAVAAAALLAVCLVLLQAQRDAVDGLREAAADIQLIDQLRADNEQSRRELGELQKELASAQREARLSLAWVNSLEYSYSQQTAQNSAIWTCLIARDMFTEGDYESCAATLKVFLGNIERVTEMQNFIRGKDYSLYEMMTEMVEGLRAGGYLSQEEADSINDKLIPEGAAITYG